LAKILDFTHYEVTYTTASVQTNYSTNYCIRRFIGGRWCDGLAFNPDMVQ